MSDNMSSRMISKGFSMDHPYIGLENLWGRVVAATVTGSMHERRGEHGQDAYAVGLSGQLMVAALCDGAGSARHGLEGARLCSQTVVDGLMEDLLAEPIQDKFIEHVFARHVEASVEKAHNLASRQGKPREYAATLVGAVVGVEWGCIFHIGDGVGVAIPRNGAVYEWGNSVISSPENGEYINETFFFTDAEWRKHIKYTKFKTVDVGVIVLMSDGVMPFAMTTGNVGPAERFMGPVCQYLGEKEISQVGLALQGTLGCEAARKVSDDDKTMIYIGFMK